MDDRKDLNREDYAATEDGLMFLVEFVGSHGHFTRGVGPTPQAALEDLLSAATRARDSAQYVIDHTMAHLDENG